MGEANGNGTGIGDGAATPTMGELRAFVAVAEELHFRRAAARLGVAPPPLSQTIRRLEDKVGAVLLDRTPHEVSLTAAGLELLPRARDILERMREARLAVGHASEGRSGVLTVGFASNGFAELTGPILRAFAEAHPRVRLAVKDITQDAARSVTEGVVDVALVRPPIGGADDPRLVVEDVVMEERAAILPRRHRLAEASVASIHDLTSERFVAVAPGMDDIAGYWAAAGERDGEATRYGSEAWTVQEVLTGVGYMGDVITSIPSVLRFYRVPGLVAVPLSDVSPAPMSIARRAGDERAVVADFLDAVRTVSARLVDLVPGAELATA
ncbi:MAG: LysR family transcriptional regulator [Thermoleophilia bacterium]